MTTAPPRAGLDRPVLVSSVVSGGLWLLVPAFLGSWPLSVIGAVYVVAASVFLAAAYARAPFTLRQEAVVWAVPWLAAVALWSFILSHVTGGAAESGWLWAPWVALVIATPCYVGWQLGAVAVRQAMAWRARAVPHPS